MKIVLNQHIVTTHFENDGETQVVTHKGLFRTQKIAINDAIQQPEFKQKVQEGCLISKMEIENGITYKKRKIKVPEKVQWEIDCVRWNKKYPPGTSVIYTDDLGEKHKTKTRTPAWLLGHGYPVVSQEGRTGGFDLYRFKVLEGE